MKLSYKIEIQQGLFSEDWTLDVVSPYNSCDDERFSIDHAEFRGVKNGIISCTGYQSHFGRFDLDNIEQYIKEYVNQKGVPINNIKLTRTNYEE